MKRWWLVIALLLSVGLNLGILAAISARRAGGRPEPRGPGPEIATGGDPLPKLPRLADRLGLEGEKRQKFLDIQWNLFQETSRLRLRLGEVHRDVRRELTRSDPDPQRIEGLLGESSRIYLALERSLVTNVLATRDVLDTDQERQYLALIGRLRLAGGGDGFGPGPALSAGPRQDPVAGPGKRQRRQVLEERWRQRFPGRKFPGARQRFQHRQPEPPVPGEQEPEEPP